MKKKPIFIIAAVIAGICLICSVAALLSPTNPAKTPPTSTPKPAYTPAPSPTFMTVWTSTPATSAAQKYVDEYGGALSAYEEILSLTDCTALKDKFDLASANNQREQAGTPAFRWTLGFMTASNDRMKAIGCY